MRRRSREPQRHGWLYWQVSDAIVLTGRALRHIPRNPELLVFSTIQPVMFVVLFRYVLGGAIKLPPGVSYVNYLMAGVFVNTVAFGSFIDRRRPRRGPPERPDRPLPLAADVARGGADRAHAVATSCATSSPAPSCSRVGAARRLQPAGRRAEIARRGRDAAAAGLRLLVDRRDDRPGGAQRRGGAVGRA